MSAIEAKGLTKRFGNFIAVNQIDLEVEEGEIFGFLGANGAGKTTTIKMLIGLLPPTSGSVKVSGVDVVKDPEKVREMIGYMSQKFSLYNDLTVEENIDFYAGIYGIPFKKRRIQREELIERFELQMFRKLLTKDLPLGLKQRLALGIAIMHRPNIVFLDEPTSGADPIARRNFWKLIQSLATEGITCFVTTHYLDEAEYCSRISLIDAGKIVASGSPSELKKKFFQAPIFEVDFGSLQRNLAVYRKGTKIAEISLFGSRLHFSLFESSIFEEDFVSILTATFGFEPVSCRRIVPTLEDVFIKAIQK